MAGKQRLSEQEIETIKKVRSRARLDTEFLAREILGYKKVSKEVHGGMINLMQKFDEAQGLDTVTGTGYFHYQPKWDDPESLTGPRRRLYLDARGHYKTTLQTITHSIQWIINFPDIWILWVYATSGSALQEKYTEIRDHFRSNKAFRYYFPDFCPQKRPQDFGTEEAFTVPNRRRISGTPTLTVSGLDKSKASSHYHVIKFFDVVDKENTITPEQIKKTIRSFGLFRNLLVSPRYWIDVEGTRYDFSDLYGTLIDKYNAELKSREALVKQGITVPSLDESMDWRFYVRGCWKKKLSGEPTYRPEELNAEDARDSEGKKIPVAPGINSYKELMAMMTDVTYGPELFAAQMENNPINSDRATFPLKLYQEVPEEKIREIPGTYEITIDTAHTIGESSNDTVISVCKKDRMQRRYLAECIIDKLLPSEIVERMFEVLVRYHATTVKIEETMFVLGLKTEISRKSSELNLFPNFVFLPRDTHTSKKDRIRNTLQPWYKNGMLRFSAGLPEWVKERIRNELARFPKYEKDDVLDTLADQFQGQDFFGPEGGRAMLENPEVEQKVLEAEQKRYLKKEWNQFMYGTPEGDARSWGDQDALTGL